MIQPTALNFLVIALMVLIFSFMWNALGMALLKNNPESGFGKAVGVLS